jgi:hypothetical protein
MSYSPAARRPIRRKKDATPILLAVVTVFAAGGLGFAVYKFVINKPPRPVEVYVPPVATVTPPPKRISSPAIANNPKDFEHDQNRGFDRFGGNRYIDPTPSPASDRFTVAEGQFSMNNTFSPGMGGGGNPYGGGMGGGGDAGMAVTKTLAKIKESVDLGKTLVIWLFDRTASCEQRRQEVARHLDGQYAKLAPSPAAGEKPADARLLNVVCSFGADVEYLTKDPTGDMNEFRSAIAGIKNDAGNVENTFQAIASAVEHFASYASPPQQRYISVVVVTDEVGNDQVERDRVAELLKKSAVPLYVIGQSASFGSTGAGANSAEGAGGQITGPESRDVEAISLDFPGGMSIAGNSSQCNIGPYSLTFLCRESGGEYYPAGGVGGTIAIPPQYYPRYVSEKEYQASLGGNKALAALYGAARLLHAKQISGPQTSFSVDENGLATVRDIDLALRPVALIMPQINDIFEMLKKGESDRGKLTEPRHQAEFDLAYGRIMAAKVRAEGYIVLLAAFKAGRKTKNGAGTWSLVQADGIEKNSVLEGMAKKSREYLEGVMKNHPNTPWAAAAQQELSQPIGWAWQES